MPTLKVSHSGMTAANPPPKPGPGGKRGEINGWSIKAARRCDAFLKSVHFDELEKRGHVGFALTFTVSRRPESHQAWARLVKRLRTRFDRMGMVCGHYVTEWQPRGRTSLGPCPHLHLVVFFEDEDKLLWIERGTVPGAGGTGVGQGALEPVWWELAYEYGPRLCGQHVEQVHDIKGWFRYLAKHAARGVYHYQRSTDTLPEGWEKTGRMWGKWGNWPVFGWDAKTSHTVFFALRRFSVRYQLSTARSELKRAKHRAKTAFSEGQVKQAAQLSANALRRIRYLKQCLKRSERKIAVIVPVNEWIPADMTTLWLKRKCEQSEIIHETTGEVQPFYTLQDEPKLPPVGWMLRTTFDRLTERQSGS